MNAERRQPSSPNMFQIRAQSIVTMEDTYSDKHTHIIFQPEAETLERLRALKEGDVLGAVALIDKWDDGHEDILESRTNRKFVSLELASRHGMKQSSWTLVTVIHRK